MFVYFIFYLSYIYMGWGAPGVLPAARYSHNNNNMVWGSVGSVVGGSRGRARVILVLCECIWNVPTVSLVLPPFDDTGSLGSPPHQVVYPAGFMVSPWATASCFLAGNREAPLKSTTFSSLLLYRVFLSFLFS